MKKLYRIGTKNRTKVLSILDVSTQPLDSSLEAFPRSFRSRSAFLFARPTSLKILCEKDTFRQVLLIALENALKHSTGDINITAKQRSRLVEIRVQDFGEGTPREKLEHILDRFDRCTGTSTIPGFGLGLPIAHSLVERQNGIITLESEVGKGIILTINFSGVI